MFAQQSAIVGICVVKPDKLVHLFLTCFFLQEPCQ